MTKFEHTTAIMQFVFWYSFLSLVEAVLCTTSTELAWFAIGVPIAIVVIAPLAIRELVANKYLTKLYIVSGVISAVSYVAIGAILCRFGLGVVESYSLSSVAAYYVMWLVAGRMRLLRFL